MAATTEYRQCMLRKVQTPSSSTVTVAFIPARFAHQQKSVRIRRPDGRWDDGWVVERVWETAVSARYLDSHQAIRSHRRATGDALPRQRDSR